MPDASSSDTARSAADASASANASASTEASASANGHAGARPLNLFAYQDAAEARLPQMAYDYYAGGAHDEITLRENHRMYDRIQLRPRMMQDIRGRSTATTLLGHALDLPVLVAPTAFHRMACDAGELATVRAAGRAGALMILSTLSTTAVEDVTAAATGPVWFQLYVYGDREATRALVHRAEAAGAEALVLTVDGQVWGCRERDERNGFQLPEGLTIKNLGGAVRDGAAGDGAAEGDTFPAVEGSGLAAYVNEQFDKNLRWKDLDWLASLTDLPVLVKGVLRGDDARLAMDHGAAGVVVSNHGGRQLDTVPATIEVLPEIAAAVDGRAPVLVDGGIRRGTDVLKALCLGADAVCVGRPILWGLATDGEDGAAHVLRLLHEELDLAMALSGITRVADATPDLVRLPPAMRA